MSLKYTHPPQLTDEQKIWIDENHKNYSVAEMRGMLNNVAIKRIYDYMYSREYVPADRRSKKREPEESEMFEVGNRNWLI